MLKKYHKAQKNCDAWTPYNFEKKYHGLLAHNISGSLGAQPKTYVEGKTGIKVSNP